MPSDLPTLIARLREARHELAERLPEYDHDDFWWIGSDLIEESTARSILIGVCAEWCAERAYTIEPWPDQRQWLVRREARVLGLIAGGDYPSALVEAVIGEHDAA